MVAGAPGHDRFNRNVSTGAIYNPSYLAYQIGHDVANNFFEIQQYAANGTGMGAPSYIRHDGLVILAENANSNVGIGTGTPNYKLDVVGNIRIEGSGDGVVFPDGSLQTTAAMAGVTTVNGAAGALQVVGANGAAVSRNGNQITISAPAFSCSCLAYCQNGTLIGVGKATSLTACNSGAYADCASQGGLNKFTCQ